MAALVALLAVVSLAACYKGEVTKKRGCTEGKPCELLVVNPESRRERWVEVSKSVWQECAIGEWYADELCGVANGMRNIPADKGKPEVNPPRRDKKREDQDRNAKEVCFDVVSEPKVRLTIEWKLPRAGSGPERGEWAIYRHCELAQVGDVATLRAEHHDNPSSVLCSIWVWRKGNKEVIDQGAAYGHLDCRASGVVR